MLYQQTGCPKDQILKLGELVSSLLNKIGMKQEDQSDKIEMLRKIEVKLNFLVEARGYIVKTQLKDLNKMEFELHNERRDKKIKKKKAEERLMLEERQRKNMARIRKQEEFKIFKGRVGRERARKPDLKPKEKEEERPSQEIID